MRAAIKPGFFSNVISFTATQPEPVFLPEKNPHEVLIKVQATSINPVDYKLPRLVYGAVVARDFAGVVEKVGSDADAQKDFKVGDVVFGLGKGSLAEKCVASVDRIAKIPSHLTSVEAAALPVAYVTSLQALEIGNVQKGSSVLVIGASGGCGLSGVQLAKSMGAARIVAICSGKNTGLVQEAGATQVVDYTKPDEVDNFFKENGNSFDLVYDTATGSGGGEDYTTLTLPLLKKDAGQYVQLNGPALVWLKMLTKQLPDNQHLILTNMNRANLEKVASLMEGCKLVVNEMPFTEEGVRDGFDLLKSRRTKGKTVFVVSS